MTHDELLVRITNAIEDIEDVDYGCNVISHLELLKALRAVVELHHPSKDKCWECSFPLDSIYVPYPCPTIQAIEKELG